MKAYYNRAVKQLNALKRDVARLESGEDTTNALQGQISAGLGTFKLMVADYEMQAKRELDLTKMEKALMRVATFNDEYSTLKTAFDRSKEKYSVKVILSKERKELLERRNVHSTAATAITIEDHSLGEHEFVNYAERQLDDYIAVGTAALQDLHNQGKAMKSAQRRILDSMNQLGLSRSVIRYIERRSSQDWWIFVIGVVFTIFCIWAILRYLR